MNEAQVLECVVFQTVDGVDRDEFLAAANTMTEWASSQDGFIDRERYDAGDGRWIDTLKWATMTDALAATEQIGQAPEASPFFATLNMATVQMMHGQPVLDPQ